MNQINRYAGTISFEDNEISSQLFFGRDSEAAQLFHFIMAEDVVIFYAKSGYGKSSILNAKICPLLREEKHYPIIIRFNDKRFGPIEAITTRLRNLPGEKRKFKNGPRYKIEINENTSHGGLKGLINSIDFWSPNFKLMVPVLILDQFEELFTLNHNLKHAETFFNTIADAISNCNLKVVISIREDFLGNLEDASNSLPQIFASRFRLESLKREQAEAAVIEPAKLVSGEIKFGSLPFTYSETAKSEILDFLGQKKVQGHMVDTGTVEPIQLQIICSAIEGLAKEKQGPLKGEIVAIYPEDYQGKEGLRRIFVQYCDDQFTKLDKTLQLADEEIQRIRTLISIELVFEKRRVPMDYDAVVNKEGINQAGIDLLIENKLLKTDSRGDNLLLEISHDALVEPIVESYEILKAEEDRQKEKRRQREEIRRQREENEKLQEESRINKRKYRQTVVLTMIISGLAALIFYWYQVAEKNFQDLKLSEDTISIKNTQLIKKNQQLDTLLENSESDAKTLKKQKDSLLELNQKIKQEQEDKDELLKENKRNIRDLGHIKDSLEISNENLGLVLQERDTLYSIATRSKKLAEKKADAARRLQFQAVNKTLAQKSIYQNFNNDTINANLALRAYCLYKNFRSPANKADVYQALHKSYLRMVPDYNKVDRNKLDDTIKVKLGTNTINEVEGRKHLLQLDDMPHHLFAKNGDLWLLYDSTNMALGKHVPPGTIRSAALTTSGNNLYLGTRTGGLYQVDLRANVKNVAKLPIKGASAIRGIFPYKDGLYIARYDGSVLKSTGKNQFEEFHRFSKKGITSNFLDRKLGVAFIGFLDGSVSILNLDLQAKRGDTAKVHEVLTGPLSTSVEIIRYDSVTNQLAVAFTDKSIQIYQLPDTLKIQSRLSPAMVFENHNKRVLTMCFGSKNKFYALSEDGSAWYWHTNLDELARLFDSQDIPPMDNDDWESYAGMKMETDTLCQN